MMKRFLTIKLGALCVFLLLIVTTQIAHVAPARASSTIRVQGAVSCSNHALSGVWIQNSGDGSNWAWWHPSSPNLYDGIYALTFTTALPTTIQVHVGCGSGSTPGSWLSDNWTPSRTINGSVSLVSSCNEGANPPSYGATRCLFEKTSVGFAAVNWASSYLGQNKYAGACLTFDFAAYLAGGIDLHRFLNVGTNNSTYPSDIFNHITYGLRDTDTPPAGALVFFLPRSGYDHTYSHIELSLGGGNMISTADTYQEGYVHYETLQEHASSGAVNYYAGWWLPA